jgi:glycosyltransferase involved in cell wall biosynthesis
VFFCGYFRFVISQALTFMSQSISSDEGAFNKAPDFSVVIPFFNEESNVGPVVRELRDVLENQSHRYEVVLVDDGSVDGTAKQLEQQVANWSAARILQLARNSGQAAALLAGMSSAKGKNIVLLDGDGQNDPRDIEKALPLLGQYDMVMGHRVNRHDSFKRRLISHFGNSVRRLFTNDGVADAGCGLKVFRREVLEAFIPIRTLYSFMPALAKAAGFSIGEIPVNHRPRCSGTPKYNLRVFLWRPALDLLGVWWFSHRRCPRTGVKEMTDDK